MFKKKFRMPPAQMSQLVNYNKESAPINSFMEKTDNCYTSTLLEKMGQSHQMLYNLWRHGRRFHLYLRQHFKSCDIAFNTLASEISTESRIVPGCEDLSIQHQLRMKFNNVKFHRSDLREK
jgi:hypothetical protein